MWKILLFISFCAFAAKIPDEQLSIGEGTATSTAEYQMSTGVSPKPSFGHYPSFPGTGTNQKAFVIGNGMAENQTIYANNGTATTSMGAMRWNDSLSQWEVSNDGVNFFSYPGTDRLVIGCATCTVPGTLNQVLTGVNDGTDGIFISNSGEGLSITASVTAGGGGGSDSELVLASATDTLANDLLNSLVAGTDIELEVDHSGGGDTKIKIISTASISGAADIFYADGTNQEMCGPIRYETVTPVVQRSANCTDGLIDHGVGDVTVRFNFAWDDTGNFRHDCTCTSGNAAEICTIVSIPTASSTRFLISDSAGSPVDSGATIVCFGKKL